MIDGLAYAQHASPGDETLSPVELRVVVRHVAGRPVTVQIDHCADPATTNPVPDADVPRFVPVHHDHDLTLSVNGDHLEMLT